MKKRAYLPVRTSEKVLWLKNFSMKLPQYAATFGITPAEIAGVVAMAASYSYVISLLKQTRAYGQSLTGFKNKIEFSYAGAAPGPLPAFTPPAAPPLTQAGIFTYTAGLVMRIKGTKDKYTAGIGEDLGIIGNETAFDASAFQPKLKVKAMPGFVEISFNKKGIDGINVYSRYLSSNGEWQKLAFDSISPCYDMRPLQVAHSPEVREYRARGVIRDEEIGQWSNIARVTFSG